MVINIKYIDLNYQEKNFRKYTFVKNMQMSDK